MRAVVFDLDGVVLHYDPARLATIAAGSPDAAGAHGLFSTTWVAPDVRRAGVASQLLTRGEHWMRERGLPRAATHTAADNAPLIRLYERHGYALVLRSGDMVRLERSLTGERASRPPG